RGGTAVGHVSGGVQAGPLHTQAESAGAAAKGDAYLDGNQNEDGSLGSHYPAAETGLGALPSIILHRGDPGNLSPEVRDPLDRAGINTSDSSWNANNTGSLLLGFGYDAIPGSGPCAAAAIVFGQDVLAEYGLMKGTLRKMIWHFGQEEDCICVFGGVCTWDQS